MRKNVVVHMNTSMEATPVAHLVSLANQFQSRVYFEMDAKKVNAKSIMGMMSLVLLPGTTVTVDAEGDDEEKAVESIESFLTR